MKKTCVELGLDACPVCVCRIQIIACWIDQYKDAVIKMSDDQIKTYFMTLICFDDWIFYFSKTIEIYFPEKKHMIDKILLLK